MKNTPTPTESGSERLALSMRTPASVIAGDTASTAGMDKVLGRYGLAVAAVVCLVSLVLSTYPVEDGDFWWQIAYGRYLIEHRTLIPDDTIYTWAHTEPRMFNSVWIAEIFLYLIYKMGGLSAVFLLRYAVVLGALAVVWSYANALKVGRHPLFWLGCLPIMIIGCASGTLIKPELFSFLFMVVTVALWHLVRLSGGRDRRYCYLLPLLMIVWVNTHVGWIYGMGFLGACVFGEELNRRFSPVLALPDKTRRHLVTAFALCFAALFITPYGWEYPAYVMKMLYAFLTSLSDTYRYSGAFSSSAGASWWQIPAGEYYGISFVFFLVIFWRVRRIFAKDFTFLLSNISVAVLSVSLPRANYVWPIVGAFSMALMLSRAEIPVWAGRRGWLHAACITCVLLAIAGGTTRIYRRAILINQSSWVGWGNSYLNPEEEAEFIKTYLAGLKIGNDYSSGGQMLWTLAPATKIMIDPRTLMFLAIFPDVVKFMNGRNVREFLARYPADVWLVNQGYPLLNDWFSRSADFNLVFYGPAAAVYVRNNIPLPANAPRFASGIDDIKTFQRGVFVVRMAERYGDWSAIFRALRGLDKNMILPRQKSNMKCLHDYVRGIASYWGMDFSRAAFFLERIKSCRYTLTNKKLQGKSYQFLTVSAWENGDQTSAVAWAGKALTTLPEDPVSLFNAALVERLSGGTITAGDAQSQDWRAKARQFLAVTADNPSFKDNQAVATAQEMLADAPLKATKLLKYFYPTPADKERISAVFWESYLTAGESVTSP